jgi:cytochrome c2
MTPKRPPGWTILLCACILTLPPHRGVAQSPDSSKTGAITTLSGVFTTAQAVSGRSLYRASCESCHTLTEFAGPPFWNEWVGKTLAELFGYIRSSMPKDNPASLGDDDYANATAFILQMNQMPPGDQTLAPDSTALSKIKVVPPDPTRKGTRS